ncbi:hypothetical protein AB4851_23925 [Burkholderia sp. 22PA0099]|uniref:hypothetical protein n=1 Tax=Burkholderia sp. 22PA0099 TaxID=3237372 RepID=UPI0039C49C0D
MRSQRIACALTIVFAGLFASNFACAQRQERGGPLQKVSRGRAAPQPARDQFDRFDEPSGRSAVSPDLDQRRRDGHMTPEERHLLRQHIEDAVRELYKR